MSLDSKYVPLTPWSVSYWRLFFTPRKEDPGSRREQQEDRNRLTSPRLYAGFRRNQTVRNRKIESKVFEVPGWERAETRGMAIHSNMSDQRE